MKKLRFGEDFLKMVISGEKEITIRKYREDAHKFVKEEIVQGIFPEGLLILLRILENTRLTKLSGLSKDELTADGFENHTVAFRVLRNFYPDLRRTDTLGVIRFEVLKVENVPVVIFLDE